MIKLIITHPGQGHADDLLACALARHLTRAPILKKDPTEAELASKEVLVLDVGGHYDPTRGNYDHHQAPDLKCALYMFMETLEYDLNAHPWLSLLSNLDTVGPTVVAQSLGINKDILFRLMGPISAFILDLWSKDMLPMASLARLGAWVAQEQADYHALPRPTVKTISGLKVAFFDEPTSTKLEAACRKYCPSAAIVVSFDDRSAGFALFRRDDHSRVDFTRIEQHAEVLFAHKNGFVAKTKTRKDPRPLIRAAVK